MKLDKLHRAIVAPRLDELMALERQTAASREKLQSRSTEAELTEWHHEAAGLIEKLSGTAAAQPAANDLLGAMHEQGWEDGYGGWNWKRSEGGGAFVAPPEYNRALDRIVEELQQAARELLLSELITSGDERVPPEYERLVERYFQVLSEETSQNPLGPKKEGEKDGR